MKIKNTEGKKHLERESVRSEKQSFIFSFGEASHKRERGIAMIHEVVSMAIDKLCAVHVLSQQRKLCVCEGRHSCCFFPSFPPSGSLCFFFIIYCFRKKKTVDILIFSIFHVIAFPRHALATSCSCHVMPFPRHALATSPLSTYFLFCVTFPSGPMEIQGTQCSEEESFTRQ